ncbi:MAG TPA: sigma-54 dependent transcriptional regulator [Candidatus Binataceae bacterium]|nr:sigma-54 dependent transcriptional regulator [Candidatus Binataceae bacterium]
MTGERIVILDDEADMAESLARVLTKAGYECLVTSDPAQGLRMLSSERPDLLLTDLRMPAMDGMEVLAQAREIDPRLPVIVLTGHASIESAVAAVKAGAFDFLSKTFSNDQLKLTVERALTKRRLELENLHLRDQLRSTVGFENIIGQSAALKQVLELVRKAARSDANILILGESGTGKEVVARATHANSLRAAQPFIAVDCASLPEQLLESELFGHEKGAFTGAANAKQGLMEVAHRGTLFLDELGELPLSLQVKLLRALQERQIRRVGGTKQIALDVRIVSATNRDLRALVAAGKFREDLYYRVNVIDIALPPLRERHGDIELLIAHFLRKYTGSPSAAAKGFAPEAMMALETYAWPGNVRELQNVIERACALADSEMITLADLPQHMRTPAHLNEPPDVAETGTSLTLKEAKDRWIGQLESAYVENLLKQEGGNVSQAARKAGVDRKTLHRLLNKHGIR